MFRYFHLVSKMLLLYNAYVSKAITKISALEFSF